MKKQALSALLALSLLLGGCANKPAAPEQTAAPQATQALSTQPTQPPATVPPDGNPEDVTCKGSYTGQPAPEQVAAVMGEKQLTNGQLSAFYWAAAAAWQQSGQEPSPDFSAPLDTQLCPIDAGCTTWQQFFLKQALNAWHTSQALAARCYGGGIPAEEAYKPNLENYEKYMTEMPATKVLYHYGEFHLNSMHQAYLDGLPQQLDTLAQAAGLQNRQELAQVGFGTSAQDLEAFAHDYNEGYMCFTNLLYTLEKPDQELAPTDGVDIRYVLLVPQGQVAADGQVTADEEAWLACEEEAQKLLETWMAGHWVTDGTFAELANKHSQDPGTAPDGGALRNLHQGQLVEPLDSWCFSPARQPGDTGILRSPWGVHLMYYTGPTAAPKVTGEQMAQLLESVGEESPMQVDYSAIVLPEATPLVSLGDILYPDVAHERFPEVPLYLQQDYAGTMFGGFKLATNGCGITSMAMVASYFTDQELTPPTMCARYGRYSFSNGTDGMIFINEPPVMGFFLREKTYEPTIAYQALEDGHLVISLQHKGYWTRGGHYIVVEKLNEDGTVQVRDSNIYNYGVDGRVKTHLEDRHSWKSITSSGSAFWIFEHKLTRPSACTRCGQGEGIVRNLLQEDYICQKCRPALARRDAYLA